METALTIATIPMILALTNLVKSFGVTGRWSMATAVALGVIMCVTEALAGGTGIYAAVSKGLILGLSAAGLYDATAAGYVAPETMDVDVA